MPLLKITNGTVYDPANNVAGVVQDIWIQVELPRFVIKAGEIVVEQGEIGQDLFGKTLHVAPGYDEGVLPDIKKWFEAYYTIQFANYPVDAHYLAPGSRAVECHKPQEVP